VPHPADRYIGLIRILVLALVLHYGKRMASAARWYGAWQPERPEGVSAKPRSRTPRWDLLLVCVGVYVATAVGRIHELFSLLLLLKPALVAAALSIGLYLLQPAGQRRIGLLRSPTTTCLLGLAFWTALTVPGALNQGLAFQTWTDLARTVLMCLVVAASVRRVLDVERLVLVYFAATVVYVAVVLSRFQLGGNNWRLDDLYTYDANDLACLIATAMPLGLYFLLGQRRVVVRVLAVVGLVILAMGLIRSGSRGGFLAFLAVVAFVLVRMTTIPTRSRIAGLVIILAVVLGTANDKYWTQMQTIIHYKEDYNMTADGGRVRIWKRGIGYMLDRPVFGVGARNFQVAEGTISPGAKRRERGLGVWWGAAHNTYVQAGAELGIPGLLLFFGMITTAFMSLRRVARRALRASHGGGEVSRLAQSLMAALVGFTVAAFFLSLAYADMLYMLLALTIGLAKTARSEAAAREPALLG
jgi:O-antigen ligase